jgi:hypothetical protein
LGWDAEAIRAYLATGQKSALANEVPNMRADARLSTCYPSPLGPEAYYGVAGEFVRLVEPHSEADSNFTLIQFLVYAGNLLGRKAYVQAGGDRHYTKLFVCGVGPTSTGRKGSATGPVQIFFQEVDEAWVRSIQSGVRLPIVFKAGRKLPHNTGLLFDFPQQQGTCIAADHSSVEPSHYFPLKMTGKLEAGLVTLCHSKSRFLLVSNMFW